MLKKLKIINNIFSCGLSSIEKLTLILIGIISGLMEMLSAGIIVKITDNYLNNLTPTFLKFEFKTWNLVFGIIFLLLILKFAINLFSVRLQSKIVFKSIGKLSSKVLRTYLTGPIENVFGEGMGIAIRNIYSECALVGTSIYFPASTLLSELIIAIILLIFLIYLNPIFLLPILIGFILSLLLLWLPVRKVLQKLGKRRLDSDAKRLQLTTDTLQIIADIKTQSLVNNFVDSYKKRTDMTTYAMEKLNFYKQLPRVSAEIIMFGSLLISLFLIHIFGDVKTIKINEISGLLFIIYRLFPAITRTFACINTIKYHIDCGYAVQEKLDLKTKKTKEKWVNLSNIKCFTWGAILEDSKPYSLEKLNFKSGINLIKGASGSGKTSLLLALAGLNKNSSFYEESNNNSLDKDSNVSYTSQSTIITGKTIKEAILAGRKEKKEIIRKFEIHLKDCFDNLNIDVPVISLSGGQIKVVSLLRSLYAFKKFHLLDEVFSGVDKITSEKCIAFLRKNFSENIFIIVDHNTLDVDYADNIINL